MAKRNGEPVKHTCPDIDRLISVITTIVRGMNSCDYNDSVDDLLENIESWANDLYSIGVSKHCELEDLRNSNASLRNWGCEMYNEAEELELERDEFEQKYELALERISQLEDELQNLEND